MEMALILFVLVMGLALGWMLAHSTVKDWYLVQVEELESALKWEKAKVQALESDLERVNLKASEKATEIVQGLAKEKAPEMSEWAKARASAQGWAWVMGLERDHLPKQ